MTLNTQLDFSKIRPYEGDQRKGFEELVCQLARRHPPSAPIEYRRVEGAGGDGGVESYWIDAKGDEHGYQAKYFLATKQISWAQIDKSVRTAIDNHPKLKSYTVALACDLTERGGLLGLGRTGWKNWDEHKKAWTEYASGKGMAVDFVPWTKSTIVDDIGTNPDRRGLALFWFDQEVFDAKRFGQIWMSLVRGPASAEGGEMDIRELVQRQSCRKIGCGRSTRLAVP